MRIVCPICGTRDVGEFAYAGDATLVRPDPAETDTARWCAYVYDRVNPKGPHREHWQHARGCRAWLVVTRDTSSHRIEAVELAGPWGAAP
jgi:heterotetrameric sarcosine oxidase delta subunit